MEKGQHVKGRMGQKGGCKPQFGVLQIGVIEKGLGERVEEVVLLRDGRGISTSMSHQQIIKSCQRGYW